MARPGITYTEVAEAATQLIGQNKNPTIEQVRLLLGSGSSTTIANHLRQWKANQEGSSLIAAKENIPPELIAIVKGLWERVIDQSEEKVRAIEADHQQFTAELQQELQKYKNNNQRWQQLFNQWAKEKEQLINEKAAISQAYETLQKTHDSLIAKQDSLAAQLEEKQDRIQELRRLHTQAQDNLEHYRESSREQRLIEQQQFEQQKQALHSELKALKDEMSVTREKSAVLQQHYQSLQQSHTTLEKNHAHILSQLETQHSQLIDSEKARLEHHQASQHWHNQYKETLKGLENKTAKLIDSQTEIKVVSQQLASVTRALEEAHDQNKLLSHDKWALAQEKAQMQGQLMQMQEMISA